MHYIYSEESGGAFSPALVHKLNPNTQYSKHFDNYCYLNFILNHPDTSFVEKRQANKEIEIAQKKMNYWKRFPKWDPEECGLLCDSVRKRWNTDLKTPK